MGEALNALLSYTPVYGQENARSIENDFSRAKGECYLDHAGATLYSDAQIKNVTADLHHSLYANPHSIGVASSTTQDMIERMRYQILDHFHTSSDEYSVIFTSGATASLKIVSESFLFNKDDSSDDAGHFVYMQDNHTSVLGMREVVAKNGAKVTCLNHDEAFKVLSRNFDYSNHRAKRCSNSLFVYPAQCNFSGLKYPLRWIDGVHNGALNDVTHDTGTRWYVLLDAAAFVPTNDLDLSTFKPDFVCLSFYKMFGYPTGIGALLVKNSSVDGLRKLYYGGGTVDVSLSSEMFHVKRSNIHQRFEDGSAPFLSIISLRHGFKILKSITMQKISKHVFSLSSFLYHSLLTLHHSNDTPVVQLYTDTAYNDCNLQGGIVSFNLKRSNGEYVGYMEVLNMAALFKIHLRTGCFCNPGACQRHLSLSNKEVLQNYDAGYVCGGAADLINGKPTGAVRISFGYMSTIKDVHTLLLMIKECFVDGTQINRIPHGWADYKIRIHEKYSQDKLNTKHTGCVIEKTKNTFSEKLRNTEEMLHCTMNDKQQFTPTRRITETKKKCVLEELYIYPIKSCGAYKITASWVLNSRGLQYDREWMIMTSSGACLTQKQQINLCLVKPIICKKTKIMTLNYPGMPPIEVPLDETSNNSREGTICQSRICGHKVVGTDCGSDVSEWLSLALGKPKLRLIRQSCFENKKGAKESDLSFSSQSQYLLINKASVSWLSDRIPDKAFQKDSILHRFRGNMILSGCSPFEEMQWKHISIRKNNFVVNGPCTRCQMICIDQTTGLRTVEPLRTLAEKFHGKLKFGIYLTKETKEDGLINIGDTIYFD